MTSETPDRPRPPTIDYRGGVPKEPWRPDETQKALAEGCLATGCAVGGMFVVMVVGAIFLVGLLVVLFALAR